MDLPNSLPTHERLRFLNHPLARRLAPLVVGVVVAEGILIVGGAPELLFFVNTRIHPELPWSLLIALPWLWLVWRYLAGHGWPRSTSSIRRGLLRNARLSSRVWACALLAGGLGMMSVDALAFMTPRLAHIPASAFHLGVNLAAIPPATLWPLIVAIAIFAGVLEEAAFRGYMLSLIQHRNGWFAAVLLTAIAFFLDHHFSHQYATWAFLPFFCAVSILHGLLVYFTRSILPSIALHAVADAIVIPFQYGIIAGVPLTPASLAAPDRALTLCLLVFVIAGAAAIPAFVYLRRVARMQGLNTSPV